MIRAAHCCISASISNSDPTLKTNNKDRPLPLARAVFIENDSLSSGPKSQWKPVTPKCASSDQLDLRGYRCPAPVIRLEAALRSLPPGTTISAIADDPVAAVDIPHFCAEAGHGVVRLPDEAGACVFQVTRAVNST